MVEDEQKDNTSEKEEDSEVKKFVKIIIVTSCSVIKIQLNCVNVLWLKKIYLLQAFDCQSAIFDGWINNVLVI
jgi:hypothetical protein